MLFIRAASTVAHPSGSERPGPSQPVGLRRNREGLLPRWHRWLAGKIRSADGRWATVEWPKSKPAGWRTGLVVEERGGLTGAGRGPRWHKPSGRERRRWSRGAAEDHDKEGEGAPGVGAELRAVSRSSEGDRGGGSWWLNDGKHDGAVAVKGRRRKKGCSWGGCSFYRRWRRERRSGETVGGAVAAMKPWARQSGGGHGWNGVGMGGTVVQTGWLMRGAHTVLYFPKLSKSAQIWK
jgi:hypothetical protein